MIGLRAVRWPFAGVLVSVALGAARGIIAARLVGPSELGAMGIAMLVLATLDAITVVSAEAALVSHAGDAEGDLDAAFTMTAIHGIIVAGLVWLAAPFVARFFDIPSAEGLTRGLGVVPLLRGFANPGAALLVKRMEFRRLFWWGLPENVAAIAIVITVGLLTHDAWSLVAAAIAAQAVSVVTSYAMWPRRPRATFSGAAFARLITFAKWIQGTRVLMFVGLNLDNFIVGKFLGAYSLGIYQAAFRLGELPVATLGRAAARVTLPLLASLRHDRQLLRTELGRIAGAVTAVTTGFALVIAIAAGPIVRILLGESWMSAVPILRVLAIAMVFRGIIVIASEAFYAAERPALAFLTNAVRVGVMAITIYPLAKYFGTMGVAVSVLVCSAAAAATCMWALASVFRTPVIHEEIFTSIYNRNSWGSDESRSGHGSTRDRGAAFTEDVIAALRRIDAHTLVDAPCGDFNWMQPVADSVREYVGVDVVRDLVMRNEQLFSTPSRKFVHADITTDPVPSGDAVFCRDCLVHFADADVWNALANFRRSGARFLITTTFAERRSNSPISTGGWRPLNLEAPPFSFPPPLERIDERCLHSGGIYRDKQLAVWEISALPT